MDTDGSRGRHEAQQLDNPSAGLTWRSVVILLAATWLARWLFAHLMPEQLASQDVLSWRTVAKMLENGQNPYQVTTVLNWPPFWLQMIYLISKAATALDVPFVQMLRVFLTGVESLVIIMLFKIIRQLAPQTRTFVPLLIGIALNPTTIFLTCQHGNFDVFVGLWVLLFVHQLIQYYRSGNIVAWLAACMFLGLGILSKTVPLALCPLLAGGMRRAPWKAKWVGLLLALGPVTLGMSVIYVLAPANIASSVLGYRSTSGWFGVTGLLYLTGTGNLTPLANGLFYLLLATGGILATVTFWKRDHWEARDIVLCTTIILAAIPGLGPGYSPQYLYWFLPLLLISCFLHGLLWQWIVGGFLIIAALTCTVEYAIIPSHGMYLYYMVGRLSPETVRLLCWWSAQPGEVTMRLPLFAAFLVLLAVGIQMLTRSLRSKTGTDI